MIKLTLAHTKWMCLDLMRQPAYVVSTIAFPVLFYAIFALPESKDQSSAQLLMSSFASFAVFGVAFLQFGVGTAQEKSHTWYIYIKSLPVSSTQLLLARLLTAMIYSLASAFGVIFLAVALTPVALTQSQWLQFLFWLFAGGISFCMMGLAVGMWASEKSALPIGNLIYLPLSFAGGLWKPPEILPDSIKTISPYLPTRHYGELVWSAIRTSSIPSKHFYGLLAWTIVFSIVAYFGYRKELRRGRG